MIKRIKITLSLSVRAALYMLVLIAVFFLDIIKGKFFSRGPEKSITGSLSSLLFFNMSFGSEAIRNSIYHPRNIEYPLVINRLNARKDTIVLDIGSGRSLPPFYLVKEGAKVCCLDLDENFMVLKDYAYKHGFKNYVENKRLNIEIGDARNLPFPDNYFDRVYAISTIEHIPNDGDISAVKEIARVLKPEGIAVLTVDCLGDYLEEWQRVPFFSGYQYEKEISEQSSKSSGKKENPYSFFIRFYDKKSMNERLIIPSQLKLVESGFYGERFNIRHYFNPGVNKFIERFFYWSQPLVSALFYKKLKETDELENFFGIIGYIVLKK